MPSRKYEDSPERNPSESRLLFSSDDDASSIEEGNKEWPTADFFDERPTRRQKAVLFINTYWKTITTLLLVAIVGLQLFILNSISAAASAASSSSNVCVQVGGDYQGKGPIFDTKITHWAADPSFVPLNSSAFLAPSVRKNWEANYPVTAAFPPDDMVYNTTSVTHQLHCVYIMAKIFAKVMVNGKDSKDMPEGDGYEEHYFHCVDYMRQAAMCSGDMTVEPRGENGGKGPVALYNAFRGEHVCKDYSQIKKYLEEEVKAGRRNILTLDD